MLRVVVLNPFYVLLENMLQSLEDFFLITQPHFLIPRILMPDLGNYCCLWGCCVRHVSGQDKDRRPGVSWVQEILWDR